MITHYKYHDIGTDNLNNNSHIHNDNFEILHILNGDGTIIIRDKIYALNSNSVFFINGSDAHYTSPESPEKYLRNKIIFSNEVLISIAKILSCEALIEDLFLNGGTAVSLSAEASSKIDECFLAMSSDNKQESEELKVDFFISIFSILKIATQNSLKAKNINNDITKIISYINKNISTNITLDMICEYSNISKSSLCRKFKKAVGMSVIEYIEFIRISYSKDLLTNTDNSISEIAQMSGFDSFAYFSKVFKRRENCTPSSYRKKHQNTFI